MGDAVRSCFSCGNALADGALFCPSCGAATPTEISKETGLPHGAAAPDVGVEEQRRRVQNALGESFQVLHLLGQGGFAEVWAATDLKLKRQVAVKVLRSDLVVSAALSERFRREAEAVAKLRHPNIVPIYQVGEGAGLSYYVMPLIEGESLRRRMEKGRLPIEEARRILEEVAGALSVAHKAGIVHRDIKPDNIMLEGEEARPVVMDFGIAKALSAGEAGLTGTGMIVGTPHYMSPEQATGEKGIDSRSDIYSLGVVAYQMLAGQLPFEGDSAQEVLVKQISAKPKALDALRTDTPVELSDAVMKCLRKEPAQRWNTAGELAAAVRPAAPGKLRAPVFTWLRRPRAALRQRRMRIELYALTLLAAVGMIELADPAALRWAWAYWSGTPEPRFEAQGYVVGSPGTPKSALTLGPGESALWSLGDSLLLVKAPIGGPYAYNGRVWRRVEYPVQRALFPPLLRSGGLWVIGLGNTRSILVGPSPAGLVVRDSLQYQVISAWSDGRVLLLGTADGRILREASGALVPEPTGVSRPIVRLLGDAPHQYALLAGSPATDSVLEFNGLNWQAVEIRPDSARSAALTGGAELEDGRGAIVGGLCDRAGPCNSPLVLVIDPASGHWTRAKVRYPVAMQLTGIWGASTKDYYVYGGENGRDCPARLTCLLHVLGDSAVPVEALRGATIIGMASLHDAPYALTSAGALWTLRGGAWGVVGEVPGSIIRGAAAGPFIGLVGWNPEPMRLGIVAAAFWRFAVDAVADRASKTEVRDVVITHDFKAGREDVWILSVTGALTRIECSRRPGRFTGWGCGDELPVPAPDRRKVLTVEVGSDDSVRVGGERGLLSTWIGNGWRTLQLPALIAGEDVIGISVPRGARRLTLTTRHLCRGDSLGAWVRCDSLPGNLVARAVGGLPAAMGISLKAIVLGARGLQEVGDSSWGMAGSPIAPGAATPTSIEALDDGRVVVGYATPDDPLLGGGLFVGGVGETEFDFERDIRRVCTFQWREVPLPSGMDVYGIAVTSEGVVVTGNGWRWITFGLSQLPFAKRPQCGGPGVTRH